MVKLILNKKYKTNIPGDVIEADRKLEERLINKGMAHYAPYIAPPVSTEEILDKEISSYDITDSFTKPKVKKPRKPRKKKAKKIKW